MVLRRPHVDLRGGAAPLRRSISTSVLRRYSSNSSVVLRRYPVYLSVGVAPLPQRWCCAATTAYLRDGAAQLSPRRCCVAPSAVGVTPLLAGAASVAASLPRLPQRWCCAAASAVVLRRCPRQPLRQCCAATTAYLRDSAAPLPRLSPRRCCAAAPSAVGVTPLLAGAASVAAVKTSTYVILPHLPVNPAVVLRRRPRRSQRRYCAATEP